MENDENDVLFLKAALKRGGFTYPILHLKDGVEAVEYFKRLEATASRLPHLIITDLEMPRMNAVHFLNWLQERSYLMDIPVIILTSCEDPATIRQTDFLEIFKLLTKKVSYDHVISSLELFLTSLNAERS